MSKAIAKRSFNLKKGIYQVIEVENSPTHKDVEPFVTILEDQICQVKYKEGGLRWLSYFYAEGDGIHNNIPIRRSFWYRLKKLPQHKEKKSCQN